MRATDKEYLNRQLAACGWRWMVPLMGKVNWADMSDDPMIEVHQAEMDFSLKVVQLPTDLLSFDDVRQLFYAMVAGEEVAP